MNTKGILRDAFKNKSLAFLMAGTVCIFMPDAIDSLSSLGLWILLYLAYNPDVQKKCQAEVSIGIQLVGH